MNGKKNGLLQMFSITKWVLGLYFKNYPFLTALYFGSEIILQLSNIVNAYILAVVTDMAISVATKGPSTNISEFVPIVALIIGFSLIFEIIRIIDNYAQRMIRVQDSLKLRQILYEQMFALGVSQMENPEIANKSQRFNEERDNILNFLQMLVQAIGGLSAFISASIVLLVRIPFIALIFGISVIFQWTVNQKFIRQLWIVSRDSTEERRRANSILEALTNPNPLKELIITRGHRYLADKFVQFSQWYNNEVRKIRKGQSVWAIIAEFVDETGFGIGIILILKRLVSGIITVGQLTFEIRSLRIFSDSFSSVANNLVALREAAIRLTDVRELFTNYEPDKDGAVELFRDKKPLEIKLENVNFKYPGSKRMVIKNLNLTIKPGEKIAIVGENGAGKTTLVKLVCRLYKVGDGKVIIGNENIDNIKISSWYEKLGVLFQDFNFYPYLTVKENVEVGNPIKDSSTNNIKVALKKADAINFVDQYPKGINQTLSERYKGGIKPSSGQWQKIAIGRFFYRDAPVLILDEPTASIDAVAEAQIFDNIYKFIESKTVIIISHRFATVRNADRIIVIDDGQIIEEGSHEELLAKNGKYAHAFKLQARGYQ